MTAPGSRSLTVAASVAGWSKVGNPDWNRNNDIQHTVPLCVSHVSISLSVCLSVYVSIDLSIYLSIYIMHMLHICEYVWICGVYVCAMQALTFQASTCPLFLFVMERNCADGMDMDGHGWTHGPSERQHDCAGCWGLVDPGGVGGHNNQIRPMFHPCHLGLMNIVRSIKEELSYWLFTLNWLHMIWQVYSMSMWIHTPPLDLQSLCPWHSISQGSGRASSKHKICWSAILHFQATCTTVEPSIRKKKRSWQNLHRANALQFKAAKSKSWHPQNTTVWGQLPLDVLDLLGSAGVSSPWGTSIQPRPRYWGRNPSVLWDSGQMVLPSLEINTDHLIQYILLNLIAFQDSSVALH